MRDFLVTALHVVSIGVIFVGLVQVLVYLAEIILASRALIVRPPLGESSILWRRYGDLTPPVAVIAPAYNEEKSIVGSVRSLLSIQYPSLEVIVVNDGSRDGTLAKLIEAFGLERIERSFEPAIKHRPIHGLYASPRYPQLLVIDKENGRGKADAMNAGISLSRAPLICAIDADSLIEPDALMRAVRPFVDDPERTIAVGGTIRIANGCKISGGRVAEIGLPRNVLALTQIVEYLRAFLLARLAWSRMETLMIVSGAFGIFRRRAVIEVGGYDPDTVGEDLELITRLHRYNRERKRDYRIEFIPEPVCWTEAPETLEGLGKQRSRWQRGAMETLFKHGDMLFRRRYGRVGSLGLGHIFLVDLIGPPVEVLGYFIIPLAWAFGILAVDYLLAFLALIFTFGVAISVASLVLEEIELRRFPKARDLLVLAGVAILENFGYRQLSNFWRVRGMYQYFRGVKAWGDMPRLGLAG
ncbi:MAG: glycosyltransferase family 2 protein [Bauldia sp.]|nr:glycosyltransferase family 2 protein [Bauldia sp.]